MIPYSRHQLFLKRCIRFFTTMLAVSLFYLGVTAALAVDSASVARGGRLFDNWFLETRDRPPSEIHPNYKNSQSSMHIAEASWRCTSCHGWDYKGRAEQNTVALTGNAGTTPVSLRTILNDENHGYSNKLVNRDVGDLATFIAHGLLGMAPYVEPGSNRALGNAKHEIALYATICANCHGANGHKISSMAYLGTFARNHPREALHKILNGHPAERMPPLRFLKTDRLGDLLAYIQTLPEKNLSASITRGGRLYDNWQKETDSPPQKSRHMAYPKEARHANTPAMNWRCKECHGWDYKGRDGAYGSGDHRTGIKGIRAFEGHQAQAVVEILMDTNHRYHGTQWFNGPLDLQALLDLANFVTLGQIDMDVHIDPLTGTVRSDPERHKGEFEVLCATCHGKDGNALSTGMSIGHIARTNPWEALHKIRNGHPKEVMPPLLVLDVGMSVGILAYAQTLL